MVCVSDKKVQQNNNKTKTKHKNLARAVNRTGDLLHPTECITSGPPSQLNMF